MTCCMSALRCTIYLGLTLFCLYVSSFSVEKFVNRPTTTKVSQVPLQSGDVPSIVAKKWDPRILDPSPFSAKIRRVEAKD